MPAPRRISIGFLMAVVGLVAADFAIVRGLGGEPSVGVAVVTLPMVNVLILAAPQLRRSHPTRPFWLGFEAGGALIVPAVGWLASSPSEVMFVPLSLIHPHLSSLSIGAQGSIDIAIVVLGYTPVLLLPAWVVGQLAARYRVVIVRR